MGEERPIGERVAALEAEVASLKAYQDKQNGSIGRLAEQYEKLTMWMLATLASALVSLGLLVVQFVARKG